MIKITNQTHSKETFLYATARAFERASFYGVRSIILLYMVNAIQLSEADATKIYEIFIAGLLLSQLLGAILGDLVLGNKKALLIGGILQALGSFALCIPSVNGLYLGIGLILLGSGLYTPNILSQFGKLYSNKIMLTDSGFSIFYTAINLGAFLGIFIITSLGYTNYILGFIIAGVLMLLSVILSFLTKEKVEIAPITNHPTNSTKKVLKVATFILLVAIYWWIYDYAYNGFQYIDSKFAQNTKSNISLYSIFSSSFIVPFGIITSIIWTFYYNNSVYKMALGFVLGVLALSLLIFIPEEVVTGTAFIFIVSMLILSVAEMHIGPILYSIITKNSNPKYLAIIISLSFIPIKILSYFSGSIMNDTTLKLFPLQLGAIILGIIAAVLIIVIMMKNKKSTIIVE